MNDKLGNEPLTNLPYPSNWQEFSEKYCNSEEELFEAMGYFKEHGDVPKKFYDRMKEKESGNIKSEVHKFVTQEEYYDLSEEEKMNGNYYHIMEPFIPSSIYYPNKYHDYSIIISYFIIILILYFLFYIKIYY